MFTHKDTIVALATASGKGSVSIVRVSGPNAKSVAEKILHSIPSPRMASYQNFYDENGSVIDQGIALRFVAPHSFTGEDVVEFQGHGGQIVSELLIEACLSTGLVRLAKPGEFSEQAFLNDKLDLTQAEAIADLIDATSKQAATSAMRSLQGQFSDQIKRLVDDIIFLRTYVEAAIDFPDEEIDFLADDTIHTTLDEIVSQFSSLHKSTKQGTLLRDGMHVVIAGKPNAGKSSLLNALSGKQSAIVTDIEGTTRDVLKEHIHIDGMPLHIIDTAGLRDSDDTVEKIGIDRAWQEIHNADYILFIVDACNEKDMQPEQIWPDFYKKLSHSTNMLVVRNKIDETGEPSLINTSNAHPVLTMSAKTGEGVDLLKSHLKHIMGYEQTSEQTIIARKRHIIALEKANQHVQQGYEQLKSHCAGELLAEDLRVAQTYLNEITGEFSSDDLLGEIFSSFCIGK